MKILYRIYTVILLRILKTTTRLVMNNPLPKTKIVLVQNLQVSISTLFEIPVDCHENLDTDGNFSKSISVQFKDSNGFGIIDGELKIDKSEDKPKFIFYFNYASAAVLFVDMSKCLSDISHNYLKNIDLLNGYAVKLAKLNIDNNWRYVDEYNQC